MSTPFPIPEADARELLAELLERMEHPDKGERLIPFYRASELCPPLTRPYVTQLLRDGVLRGQRFRGLTLIEEGSVREFIASFVPWKP